mmetsp:Transcript_91285/g.244431  ORF Transcript_91285/g.244431 Transcript_91285/m.244431 type:complete len:288 (+) Transcript_91285:305-1168(+)
MVAIQLAGLSKQWVFMKSHRILHPLLVPLALVVLLQPLQLAMQPEPVPHVTGQRGVSVKREFVELNTHLLHASLVLGQLVRQILLKILETDGLHPWHTHPKLLHRVALVLDICSPHHLFLRKVHGLRLEKLHTPIHLAKVLLPQSFDRSQREMVSAVFLVHILAERSHENPRDTVVPLGRRDHLLGHRLLGRAGPDGHARSEAVAAPPAHPRVVGKFPSQVPHHLVHRPAGVDDIVLAAALVDGIAGTHAINGIGGDLFPPPRLLLPMIAKVVRQLMGLQKSRLPDG